jgi:hypothetical protein
MFMSRLYHQARIVRIKKLIWFCGDPPVLPFGGGSALQPRFRDNDTIPASVLQSPAFGFSCFDPAVQANLILTRRDLIHSCWHG